MSIRTNRRRQWIQRYNPERARAESRDDWATPEWVMELIEDIYDVELTIDASADRLNRKCQLYFSIERPVDWPDEIAPEGWLGYDGIAQPWHGNLGNIPDADHVIFNNPPYSAEEIPEWLYKALNEYETHGMRSINLLPAHTDRPWFNLMGQLATSVVNGQGRIPFIGTTTNNTTGSVLGAFGLQPRLRPWRATVYPLDLSGKAGVNARKGLILPQ